MSSVTLTELDAHYRFTCEIANTTASRAFSWYQQLPRQVIEQKKNAQRVISDAYHNVKLLVSHLINERFPEDGIMSKAYDNETAEAGFIWVINPIDGTSHVANGLRVPISGYPVQK